MISNPTRPRTAGVLLALVLGACAHTAPPEAHSPAVDAPVAAAPPVGWQEFKLPGKRGTRYMTVRRDGAEVIRAEADASASMLRRTLDVAARDLGGVEFSWRVDGLIPGADLSERDSSDSPARLVLAFDGDARRLSARNRMVFELAQTLTGEAPPFATLMYVWDNKAAPETVIHSGRTDRVRKIVVESGPTHAGHWRVYRRDVVADFRRAFGEAPGTLIGVALMTDADNTGARASADYGVVRFLPPAGRAEAPRD